MVPDIVKSSRAKNTSKKYDSYFLKFVNWCKKYGFSYLPAKESILCLFFSDLIKQKTGKSTLESYFYSIKWNHDFASISPNPCDSRIVKMTFEGGRRLVAKPVSKKEPITSDIIGKIVDFYEKENNLKGLRVCTMCILGFSGFLRFNEIASLRMKDVKFHNDFISICISRSKTDQLKKGASIDIARTNNKLCPVSWLLRYVDMAGLTFSSNEYIFTRIRLCKNRGKYILADSSVPLSYTRAREIFLEALQNVGEDKSLFGLHSLRSGGASAFANNENVCDPLLMNKHGRWKSSSSSEGYVHFNLNKRLSVSKNLGI